MLLSTVHERGQPPKPVKLDRSEEPEPLKLRNPIKEETELDARAELLTALQHVMTAVKQ